MRRLLASIALTAALLGAAPAHALEERRAAVIVGNRDGGEGTRPLRYALSDAERIQRILVSIGGLSQDDAQLLRDPTADQVLAALAEADRKAQGGVVLFYYSGHSKDGSLRLGHTQLPLDALKQRLGQLNARVKVAILDSCKSGEMIRTKGGRVGPAFEVTAEPSGPRGLAVLASSAADEDSQESDLLGASFFTHFLASGLVGDADASGDGKITLQEAYAYAYARTVAQTAEAKAGLQHPTYAYSLAGAGEVWLTDVAKATAALVLPKGSQGSYVIVDAQKRTLVAEIDKQPGQERKVALPAGRYEVKRREGDGALFARVKLSDGDVVTVEDSAMARVALARNVTKGVDWAGDLATMRPGRWTLVGNLARQGFFGGQSASGYFPNLTLAGVQLEARDRWESPGRALAIDLGAGSAPLTVQLGERTQVASQVTQVQAGAAWLFEWELGRLRPYVGPRLSFVAVRRSFDDPRFAPQGLLTMAPGLVAGVEFEVTRSLGLGLQARANYLLYRTDEDLSLGYMDAGLMVRWEL